MLMRRLSGEATNTNFGLTRPGLEHYLRIRVEHANNYTTDAIQNKRLYVY